MKITDILVREGSILDLVATGKDDLLAELAGALASAEPALDRDALLTVLREREALQSTGIGEGVAIPHGKIDGLDRLVATFARSTAGVDFESIDGQPTHLFFLLVVPEQSGGQHPSPLHPAGRAPQSSRADHAEQVQLSKMSVKYAKMSQNVRQISLNFSQNFAPDWSRRPRARDSTAAAASSCG